MKTNRLLVITSYPPNGTTHHQSTVGIASCAKNTLTSLKKTDPKLNITILAERLGAIPENTYTENGMTIKRIWQRNSITTFPIFLREISKTPDVEHIMFQFGFSIYGKLPYLALLPLFLFILKLTGKQLTFVLHEVVPSAQEIAGHIHVKNSILIVFFNLLFKAFYKMLILLSFKIIVFEEIFKKRLSNNKKVVVIPIGIEKKINNISQKEARKKLNLNNDFTVMTFGYFAWYKGTDWIANVWRKTKNIKLIIAGGENPNRTELPDYIDYSKNIRKMCRNNNVWITGFIPEKKLPLYFAAADIVIFPYRTLMGASASLATAVAFQKPFLLSEALSPVLETNNFDKRCIFALSKTSLLKKLNAIKKDHERLGKMVKISQAMAQSRRWNYIGKMYYETLFK